MSGLKSALLFVLQSIVAGLAVAFVVVLIRPDLLPALAVSGANAPASYADAVDLSAPAVANIYVKRLVEYSPAPDERTRFRVETSFGSAVVIDPEGYIVTNYHVVAHAKSISVTLSDGRKVSADVVGHDWMTDVAVSKENLLGQEGNGFAIAMFCLEQGRYTVAAGSTGLIRASRDASIEYSLTLETESS